MSGQKLELHYSIDFHSEATPLLVSPKLLRIRNLGQIDLARLKKDKNGWIIEVAEVKSSEVGIEGMERFQIMRLYSCQNFLSSIFGFPSKLIRLIK